jgi:hypothetical protein
VEANKVSVIQFKMAEKIPSMLSPWERVYLREFAKNDYLGEGAIVDLGCWLGASSVELAQGLRENPRPTARAGVIHAYDLFLWDASWMNEVRTVQGTPLEGKYKDGDSFLDEYRQFTEPWKDSIRVYPSDLTVTSWSGGPIEFIFVDAMKSWSLANSIVRDFYSSLVPGISMVVHQDFGNFYVYWLHLVMYRLREYFQPAYDMPYASSVAFNYVKQIPESLLQAHYDLSLYSNDEIDAAFEYSRRLVGKVKQLHIAMAKLRCCFQKGDRFHVDLAFIELSELVDLLYTEGVKLDELKQENDSLRAEAKVLRGIEAKFHNARADLSKARSDFDLVRSRISAMESSKFWKLRHHWFRVKRALHLPGWETE